MAHDFLRKALPGGPFPSRAWSIVLFISCALAFSIFIVRGPYQVLAVGSRYHYLNSNDFKTIYSASRTWGAGGDPYSNPALLASWSRAGGSTYEFQSILPFTPSVFPPTTFVVLSPISRMPWQIARVIWCLLNVASAVVMVACLLRIEHLRWNELRALLLITSIFAFRPLSTAVLEGQPSIIVAVLGVGSMLLTEREYVAAAILQGLALALKPQVALVFLLNDLCCRRWRKIAIVAASVGVLAGVALIQLNQHSEWLANWYSNLKIAATLASVDVSNRSRDQLINLQFPLALVVSNPAVRNVIVILTAVVLALPPIMHSSTSDRCTAMLNMSILAVVTLMISYHRQYDAVLLAFPIGWASCPGTPVRLAWPVFAIASLFLMKGLQQACALPILGVYLFLVACLHEASGSARMPRGVSIDAV